MIDGLQGNAFKAFNYYARVARGPLPVLTDSDSRMPICALSESDIVLFENVAESGNGIGISVGSCRCEKIGSTPIARIEMLKYIRNFFPIRNLTK